MLSILKYLRIVQKITTLECRSINIRRGMKRDILQRTTIAEGLKTYFRKRTREIYRFKTTTVNKSIQRDNL